MRFYSQTTGCTYLPEIHSTMPSDASPIAEDVYLSVIGNPAPGKVRAHDERGMPYLVDAPVVIPDLAAQEREWRDIELSSVIWLRDRHRDQVEIGVQTTLTTEQFDELLVYMQALRDWPQSLAFPDSEQRPVSPPWIAESIRGGT